MRKKEEENKKISHLRYLGHLGYLGKTEEKCAARPEVEGGGSCVLQFVLLSGE